MECKEENGSVHIKGITDFVPERIFECGQCFRWNVCPDGSYIGVAMGKAARVNAIDGIITISGTIDDFNNVWHDYFDLGRDYEAVRKSVIIDEYMKNASEFGKGVRILRQDRWEALCTFIISQCNNIKRIKGIVERLCSAFGEKIIFEGKEYYTFPTADRLSALSERDLDPLRAGYRAAYLLSAARAVSEGTLSLDELDGDSSEEARIKLKKLNGVGDKVANCMILFGLGKLDAFPVDVWMKKAMKENYSNGLNPDIFGKYAGVAQQYIFFYARSHGKTM